MGTFTKGAPLSKADISDEGMPFILYGELYTTYKEVTTQVKRKTLKNVDAECLSRIGDVIIPTSGETAEEIATATCVMLPDVVLAGDLNIYRNNDVDGRIVSYIINHIVNGEISRIAQGKSVVHIKADELSKIQICYPNKAEQKKIVNFLALLDRKIERQRRLIECLKSYKRGVLQSIFSAEATSYSRLKNLIVYEPKSNISAGDSCEKGKYILYRSGQKDGKCNEYTHNGVYIIANDGGEAYFKITNGKFAYTDHCICFQCSTIEKTIVLFNYLQMLSSKITYEGFVGSGLKNIDRQYFNNLKIPDISHTYNIAKCLLQIDCLLQKQDMVLKNLFEIKKSLLQQLFI